MFNGDVNTTIKYVCDNSVFRVANEIEVEADSACTSYNRNKYYILSKYGGKNNYSYYKCTEDGWTFTTEKLNQGIMIDERDGHEYKTIGIKSQMWMAENLNYSDDVNYPSMLGRNWCMNDADSCAMFGRYYTWSAAIDSVYWSKQGKICGYEDIPDLCGLSNSVQGICPKGWHIPNNKEWNEMYLLIDSNYRNMQAKNFEHWTKATNKFGFSALPAGMRNYLGAYANVGFVAYFWSSSEGNEDYNYGYPSYWHLDATSKNLIGHDYCKNNAYSVRCIKDEE